VDYTFLAVVVGWLLVITGLVVGAYAFVFTSYRSMCNDMLHRIDGVETRLEGKIATMGIKLDERFTFVLDWMKDISGKLGGSSGTS